ncbi:MAG TPA: hypothetical protein VJ998_11990 [Pseudomonadales bacterium]|nr:hypothetical protein [Pseudomonadales bacterium]
MGESPDYGVANLDPSNLLLATFELGLPVALLSWLLFYRLYSSGELPRDVNSKAIRASLKQINKARKKIDKKRRDVLHTKWMKFGGGFYGVAALWTFVVMEVGGIVATLAHPSSIEGMFSDGLLRFMVQVIVNQITTFVNALLWFSYWGDKGHGIFLWGVVAYGGYVLGLNLARYEVAFANQALSVDWLAHLRSWLSRWIKSN